MKKNITHKNTIKNTMLRSGRTRPYAIHTYVQNVMPNLSSRMREMEKPKHMIQFYNRHTEVSHIINGSNVAVHNADSKSIN